MVVFESFLFIAAAVFLLFDSVLCSCQLTQLLEADEVSVEDLFLFINRNDHNLRFSLTNVDQNRENEIMNEINRLEKEFNARKAKGYYSELTLFNPTRIAAELIQGDYEIHNFAGVVTCYDGRSIHPTRARVQLLEPEFLECRALHNRPDQKSAEFEFPGLIRKHNRALIRYRFLDVCFIGHEAEFNAFLDGVGKYVLYYYSSVM